MIKLRSKNLFKRSSNSKQNAASNGACGGYGNNGAANGTGTRTGEIEWEVRPGGMLVQKRESGKGVGEVITVRVSTGSAWHDISIGATSTFGELKAVLSMVTGLEPKEQRLLFKGKERENEGYLHMVGVRDRDKVLLLEDPALKERKLRAMAGGPKPIGPGPYNTPIEV
ncbi:BAG family molecular chaperone regulator 2 [Rhynchospora pubera]|uniref:BAG family molecular chaperone regulator 2 n=1 Tax=Rhynchospora pubera TaxID=906938 RepID=A0AAV8HCJ9_9POAL|nr:BAG family molecular chaperone regulator 2 [Rhynchospora pubera]